MNYPKIEQLRLQLQIKYPYLVNQVDRNFNQFGEEWAIEFDDLLAKMFTDEASIAQALKGYSEFLLDIMRLMKRFEKEQAYVAKSYSDVAKEVYHNEEFMMALYLPGILLSRYLWANLYRQTIFFKNNFVRDFCNSKESFFYEVGIGTGFHSRYLLDANPNGRGIGFDISDFSIRYTGKQVEAYNCQNRYQIRKRNVVTEPVLEPASFLMSVEVLEHLEDPLAFLKALRSMLKPGGKAFITAAITAPEIDHIYLYRTAEEVLAQIKEAGFKLEQYLCAPGYVPQNEEAVPMVAAFIVV
jgi:SAM-dependent methyltransferase